MVAHYLSLLGGELFTRLYIFFEPIGRMAELTDLDMGLWPHDDQFFEVHMVQEEIGAFHEALEEGWDELAEAFMLNVGIQDAADGELQQHDVM